MAFEEKREHDDEDVALRPSLLSHIDGPHLETGRLHVPEVLLDERKVFVPGMEGLLVRLILRHVALYHVAVTPPFLVPSPL